MVWITNLQLHSFLKLVLESVRCDNYFLSCSQNQAMFIHIVPPQHSEQRIQRGCWRFLILSFDRSRLLKISTLPFIERLSDQERSPGELWTAEFFKIGIFDTLSDSPRRSILEQPKNWTSLFVPAPLQALNKYQYQRYCNCAYFYFLMLSESITLAKIR